MPPVNKLNPRSAFKENFSFRIRKEKAIVNNIDNFLQAKEIYVSHVKERWTEKALRSQNRHCSDFRGQK